MANTKTSLCHKFTVNGTLSVISSDFPGTNDIARFKVVHLKHLSDIVVILGLKVFSSDESRIFL